MTEQRRQQCSPALSWTCEARAGVVKEQRGEACSPALDRPFPLHLWETGADARGTPTRLYVFIYRNHLGSGALARRALPLRYFLYIVWTVIRCLLRERCGETEHCHSSRFIQVSALPLAAEPDPRQRNHVTMATTKTDPA